MAIETGDRVRSYDFPGFRDDSYVEGVVEGVTDPDTHEHFRDCARYVIRVERQVAGGQEVDYLVGELVYPPLNGTPSMLGGVTNGVELAA